MPLQLYDKEETLDACLSVFARHGYDNTSTAMLAEAAGVSKALLFHHFRTKKNLYLCVLDRCFEKGRAEMGFDALLEQENFFDAKEKFSAVKFDFYLRNHDLYKFVSDAFWATPHDVKTEITERYGALIANKDQEWERLFDTVPLKAGVDREEAFRLVMLVLDYCDDKFLAELPVDGELNEAHFRSFLDERNRLLAMVRFGIEK